MLTEVTATVTPQGLVLTAGATTHTQPDYDIDAATTALLAQLPTTHSAWYRALPTQAQIDAARTAAQPAAPTPTETVELTDATEPTRLKRGQFSLITVRSAEHPAWFTRTMAPFFKGGEQAKDVKKTLARDLQDSEDRTWVIALDAVGQVAAFAAVKGPAKNGVVEFVHAYTTPTYRTYGLHTELIRLRVRVARDLGARLARATATEQGKVGLEAAGFRAVIKKGRYDVMELTLDPAL